MTSSGEVVLDRPIRGADPRDRGRFGGWIFRQRSWLPVGPTLVLLLADPARAGRNLLTAGVLMVLAGQALRFWAVRHIGTVSRTRTTRLGPLVTSGPYAFVRNPLYLGNWLLWTGFILASRVFWMLPVAWTLFAVQYGAITRWEEDVMSRAYPAYSRYAATVNRWIPAPARHVAGAAPPAHQWPAVLFSERSTLAAIAVMTLLLVARDYLQ